MRSAAFDATLPHDHLDDPAKTHILATIVGAVLDGQRLFGRSATVLRGGKLSIRITRLQLLDSLDNRFCLCTAKWRTCSICDEPFHDQTPPLLHWLGFTGSDFGV